MQQLVWVAAAFFKNLRFNTTGTYQYQVSISKEGGEKNDPHQKCLISSCAYTINNTFSKFPEVPLNILTFLWVSSNISKEVNYINISLNASAVRRVIHITYLHKCARFFSFICNFLKGTIRTKAILLEQNNNAHRVNHIVTDHIDKLKMHKFLYCKERYGIKSENDKYSWYESFPEVMCSTVIKH